VLDKFAAVQMLDVHFPTTDGRTLILSRYTQLTVIVAFYEAYLKEAAIK
jgi:peroxiredoxin